MFLIETKLYKLVKSKRTVKWKGAYQACAKPFFI